MGAQAFEAYQLTGSRLIPLENISGWARRSTINVKEIRD
jgi:hypothetical protein